jgi:hypothetical protein
MGRGLPTTFVVRISIDRQNKSVVWFEDAHDGDGDLGHRTQTWRHCEFLDDSNWHCETGVMLGQRIPNDTEMKNGKLIQRYYDEVREFKLRRKILGFMDPPLKEVGRHPDDVETFFKEGSIGKNPDYALETRGLLFQSEWYLTAVFFGANDNSQVCEMARNGVEYPGKEYRCRQLNK